MGWLWATQAAPSPQDKTISKTTQPSFEATNTSPEASIPTNTQASNDNVDKELEAFLKELEADIHPQSKKYNRVPRPPPSTTSPSTYNNKSSQPISTNDVDSPDPLSEQLLPTTMSCRDAFDAAFYCNSFGGRFNDLYRYGTLRSCSESWNDFWFCMKTRSYSGGEKAEAIKTHYREKERGKYKLGQGSSEDVWRSREGKVEWGDAFSKKVEGLFQGGDEEWNRRERERRRVDIAAGKVE